MYKIKNRKGKANNTSSARSKTNVKSGIIIPKLFQSSKFQIISGVSTILILIFLWWYLGSFAPNIKIYAEVQNKTVQTQQDITANFGETTGIQAFTKSQTETGSDTQPTTGTGKAGKAATGAIRATYLQAAGKITIKAGTVVTCSNPTDCGGKALNFVTLEDHSFSLIDSPVVINLQASDIGADYNLKTGIKFKVAGVAESDLSATNTSPFTGGESHDTRTVTQKDLDDLKNRLTETLKTSAYSKITASAGENSTILSDKTKTEIKSVKSDKKVGDEADSINMDMEVNITANGYDKTTVRPFVESLLQKEEKDNLKLDLTTVTLQQNVKSSNDKSIVITISASAILRPQISKDEIVKNLLNKPLSEIKTTLEKIPNVKNISYIYSPSWSPDFLKHVPSSGANVNLELKEVSN